jgi:hypothetical protein
VRVAEALDRAGTPPEHLGEVIEHGRYTFGSVDALFADPSPLSVSRWNRPLASWTCRRG